jgi:hypothetical protein
MVRTYPVTRKSEQASGLAKGVASTAPTARREIVCDNINIHLYESVVRLGPRRRC